jgi:type IV secretory pathway component VirB8
MTDDVLESAADALETSKRWAPRAAIVVGVVAVAAIGVVVVMRLRRRDED